MNYQQSQLPTGAIKLRVNRPGSPELIRSWARGRLGRGRGLAELSLPQEAPSTTEQPTVVYSHWEGRPFHKEKIRHRKHVPSPHQLRLLAYQVPILHCLQTKRRQPGLAGFSLYRVHGKYMLLSFGRQAVMCPWVALIRIQRLIQLSVERGCSWVDRKACQPLPPQAVVRANAQVLLRGRDTKVVELEPGIHRPYTLSFLF